MNSLLWNDGEGKRLFSRHLDLRPLRGRRRGLVKCIFHEDRSPSLSVDLDAGIFNCFGCGASGGVKRFADLVGERMETLARPVRPRSPLAEALAQARVEAERQRRRLEPYCDLFAIADYLRPRFQAAAEARRVATGLGPTERAWEILTLAAKVEQEALAVEAELDAYFPFPWGENLDAPLGGDLGGEGRS